MKRTEGKVVRLVTDNELLINLGSEDGVKPGDEFRVLDPRTMDVMDRGSSRSLGSIERVKARVQVTQVNEHMALARVTNRTAGLSAVARVMSGEPRPNRLTSAASWPDGVELDDPVVKVKRLPPKPN